MESIASTTASLQLSLLDYIRPRIEDTPTLPKRLCLSCGKHHSQLNSPVCSACRHSGSKKLCPVEGCMNICGLEARSCLQHRRLFYGKVYEVCCECQASIQGRLPVCKNCQQTLRILCACGCGRYRRKYGAHGQACLFISGHNDNHAESRRPLKKCDVCGREFKAVAIRQRLCSTDCRAAWFKLNPPNARKAIRVTCACCGKIIYRQPNQLKPHRSYACSKRCRYIIVANKLQNRPPTDPKKIVLRRDNLRCVVCGFDIIVEVHHVIARRHGGPNTVTNMVTLCPNHHAMADRNLLTQKTLYAYIPATMA